MTVVCEQIVRQKVYTEMTFISRDMPILVLQSGRLIINHRVKFRAHWAEVCVDAT